MLSDWAGQRWPRWKATRMRTGAHVPKLRLRVHAVYLGDTPQPPATKGTHMFGKNEAMARVNVFGDVEGYATVAEANERAAFLRSVGYVPWVTVRTGITTWTDVEDISDAELYADHSDPDSMPTADDVTEMRDWASDEFVSAYRSSAGNALAAIRLAR